jgi:hypothetical protein
MPKKKTPTKPAPAANPQPPADTTAFPPSTQTVMAQLDTENGMTAAEVAESSSLGRSTVTKALSTLHDAGLAVRRDGGFDGTRRIADRWFAVPGATDAVQPDLDTDDPDQPAADDDAQAEPVDAVAETGGDTIGDTESAATDRVDDEPPLDILTGSDSEPDEFTADSGPGSDDEPADGQAVDGIPDGDAMHDGPEADEPTHTETAEPDHTRDADAASVPETDEPESERADEPDGLAAGGSDADGDDARSEAAQPDPVHPVAVLGAAGAEASAARLGKGELRAQVKAHLRENPDRAWTPTAISKVLNRSAGAINNACEKLLETEAVTTFDDKPRRFQWRPDQDASAA